MPILVRQKQLLYIVTIDMVYGTDRSTLCFKGPRFYVFLWCKKGKYEEEYDALVSEMLKESDLIIAQEFCPSDYDWRIGIIDNKPFFACRYYMAKGHWQIYNWKAKNKNDKMERPTVFPLRRYQKMLLILL